MTITRFLFSLLAIGMAYISTPLHAAQNSCDGMSTANESLCLGLKAKKDEVVMHKSYDHVIAAAEALMTEIPNLDFRPTIENSQHLWKQWMEDQCRLESIVVMGSAGV